MKKYAPLVVTAVVLIGIITFFLMKGTTVAPQVPADATSTVPVVATSTSGTSVQPGGSPAIPGIPSNAIVKRLIKNDTWDIEISVDPTWQVSDNGTVVTVDAPDARFIVGQGTAFAEPARSSYVNVKHEVLGEKVTAHRYANPNDGYAFYDYFSVRVSGDTYYFNVRSKVEGNAAIDAFLEGVKKK